MSALDASIIGVVIIGLLHGLEPGTVGLLRYFILLRLLGQLFTRLLVLAFWQ
jgi:hypothetical protein